MKLAGREVHRRRSPRLLFSLFITAWCGLVPVFAQEAPPPNLKIAFIGDQSLGGNAIAVLNLIKSENAQAVLHSGDLDYTDNPAAWEQQVNSVLGPNFPYFVTVGNHDELAWRGPTGYQQFVINRFNRLGITWSGDLGVQSTFHFNGVFFVLTPPGIGSGFDSGAGDSYIRDQLAGDNSVWTICSWHKNMKLMQVGLKEDETGWAVYEEARKGGAIIATAHEHSYSRTHLLSNMIDRTTAASSNNLTLTRGNTFAFVSGLGGHSIRAQSLSGNWWASIAAATCLAGDASCQPTSNPGALFGVFNVDGVPNKAYFYFKDTSGRVLDSFTVFSDVERPGITSLSPSSAVAGGSGFTLTVDGQNFGNQTVVQWNGAAKPTTLVSSTRLTATISAADIAHSGAALVTVVSPGGSSAPSAFSVGPPPIVLLTELNSQRALAFDSITLVRYPLLAASATSLSGDGRLHVMIFSPGLTLAPGDSSVNVVGRAQDLQGQTYPLPIEFVGPVPESSTLTQIVFRVPVELVAVDSFWVNVSYGSAVSNQVLIQMK